MADAGLQIVDHVFAFLKDFMRIKKIRYKYVAKHLRISEASFKRVMNSNDISLGRLIKISNYLGFDFYQLCEAVKNHGKLEKQYSSKQEKFLSEHPLACYIFILLQINFTSEEICKQARITSSEFEQVLLQLDKVDLVQFWSQGKYQILHGPYNWIQNGPLQKVYFKKFSQKISDRIVNEAKPFASENSKHSDLIQCFEFYAHPRTHLDLQNELKIVLNKYRKKSTVDKELYSKKDLIPISGCISAFQQDTWREVLIS